MWRHDKFGLASVAKWCLQTKQCAAALQIQHGENVAVLAGKANKAKMEQCLGWGPLSLSLVSFLFTIYFVNFLKLFVHLVILSE